MIQTKKDLKEFLGYERQLYGNKIVNSFVPRISEQGLIWKYVILLRKCEYFFNTKKRIRYRLYYFRFKQLGLKLGYTVPLNVIDKGLLIYHRGNIVINADYIGKNVSIAGTMFCVAKGQTSEKPTIGDNVSIGMNATFVGGIKIASMIAVGAGSVVTKSFLTENVTIAGNPARVINDKEGSSSWGGWKSHFGKSN